MPTLSSAASHKRDRAESDENRCDLQAPLPPCGSQLCSEAQQRDGAARRRAIGAAKEADLPPNLRCSIGFHGAGGGGARSWALIGLQELGFAQELARLAPLDATKPNSGSTGARGTDVRRYPRRVRPITANLCAPSDPLVDPPKAGTPDVTSVETPGKNRTRADDSPHRRAPP